MRVRSQDPNAQLLFPGDLISPSPIKEAAVIIDEAGGPVMATAVAQAIQQSGTIAPRVEGRITIVP